MPVTQTCWNRLESFLRSLSHVRTLPSKVTKKQIIFLKVLSIHNVEHMLRVFIETFFRQWRLRKRSIEYDFKYQTIGEDMASKYLAHNLHNIEYNLLNEDIKFLLHAASGGHTDVKILFRNCLVWKAYEYNKFEKFIHAVSTYF